AVIAAGAVVTKDVEPYAVVAGVPARTLRKRFPDPLIERLLASQWWNYGFPQFAGMDVAHPEAFLDRFEAAKSSGALTPLPAPRPFIDVVREALASL
ncbi:MAG: hypothetical protein JWO33_1078, partial [Caulobacteraceae bacterium]|nr:hypothetical protein [Caulobacteraceae bacterium]